MKEKINEFNIVIVGVGGQGLLTILQILAEAALSQGYEVRTSELHGLAQRGGSIEVHIRFGKGIFSPLVSAQKADLIMALEMQEALHGAYFANEKTKFLLNQYIIPIPPAKTLAEEEIISSLKKISKDIHLIPAREICQRAVATDVVAGIYLLGVSVSKKILPLEEEVLISAIKKIIPEKYLELNLKSFNLAKAEK
ncbi:MAG: indolepyruvate oxidoreductase subunit beta [bacterium]|nr:indolepyruvate oxidoreductase subunit beta [bacterium]